MIITQSFLQVSSNFICTSQWVITKKSIFANILFGEAKKLGSEDNDEKNLLDLMNHVNHGHSTGKMV